LADHVHVAEENGVLSERSEPKDSTRLTRRKPIPAIPHGTSTQNATCATIPSIAPRIPTRSDSERPSRSPPSLSLQRPSTRSSSESSQPSIRDGTRFPLSPRRPSCSLQPLSHIFGVRFPATRRHARRCPGEETACSSP